MPSKKCSCGCGGGTGAKRNYVLPENGAMTLADLPIGSTAVIDRVLPDLRERKKFADVGMVSGASLTMEGHAPFGGLLRVRILDTSVAIHKDDAAKIILKKD